MLLMSFILIGSLLFILFDGGETIQCPTASQYTDIGMGCYKINNGSFKTWSAAREDCLDDSLNLTMATNATIPNATTHLIALEAVTEKTALFYWLTAFQVKGQFWIDGIVPTSTWNWSNQSIVWYFTEAERAVIGNGSNYKIISSNQSDTNYQIADDINSKQLYFICEYQMPCNGSATCQNGATCYLNMGEQLCLCAPGYTGTICDTEINECLSSPCLHDGNCTDGINNYTCDCSQTFYYGENCEIPQNDPTQSERTAAFWSVLGVVTGLVVLLTLSDLPWEDILSLIGCSCDCFKCCSKQNDVQPTNENELRIPDSPTYDQNYGINKTSIPSVTSGPKRTNYHVMNTVWEPEYIRNQTPIKPQYNGYRSPDQTTTFDNTNIQSFATVVMAKQKQKEIDDKRIYAVNINEPTAKTKNSVDTMVNWTQQLQEQLRNKKPRETSASSTNQLIHSSNSNNH